MVILTSANFTTHAQEIQKISFNKLNQYYPLYRGFELKIYEKTGADKYVNFIIDDSVAWLISNDAFLKTQFYKDKLDKTEELLRLMEDQKKNLLEQKDATIQQLQTEINTNDKMIKLLDERRLIAEESLKLLDQVKLKSRITTSALAIVAGILWVNNDDESWLKIAKIVGTGGAGVAIAFSFY